MSKREPPQTPASKKAADNVAAGRRRQAGLDQQRIQDKKAQGK